jgi:alkylation response protein AidB-like acyl-CoA dehydrogenase
VQFTFNEDQRALADAAHSMLMENCTAADLRRLVEQGDIYDAGRLTLLREMGMFGVLSPEAQGGLGLQPIDFALVAESAGYVALPEPFIEQAGVAVSLLASLSDNRGWLERATQGTPIAIGSPLSAFVLDADMAEALLLPHGDEIHLLESSAVRLKHEPSIDPLRRLFRVEWTPSDATRLGIGWRHALDLGALWTAGQLIGLAQRAVDLTVVYAKERTQFGKPIGSYQAVKHHLASAQVKIEFARPVYHAAAAEFDRGAAAAARVSHAKLAATSAADAAMRAALQVHGAMGFTWEAGLHFYLKRALALRYSWGDDAYHRARVIQRVTHLPTGPAFTFSSEVMADDTALEKESPASLEIYCGPI